MKQEAHQLLHALKLETELLNPQGNLYCYPRLAEEYPDVPTGIICAAETRARKVFRRSAEAVLHSETSLPRFRKDSSIPVPVAGYKILQDEDHNVYADVQLLSRQGTKTQKLPGRIRLVLADNWRDQTAKAALQQIEEGKVKRGVASLFRVKNDWYFQIPYVTEAVNTGEGFEPELVMGVAFGLQDALVYAFNTSLKPLRHLYETERNYRSLVNSRYAKWIVDIAVKNRCGMIHLDSANYVSPGKKILLSRWPLYDLKEKIRRKAEEKGIQVTECNILNLRTRCSRCGEVQKTEGDKRAFFCKACGYGKADKNKRGGYISIDYNAARNLAVYISEGKTLI